MPWTNDSWGLHSSHLSVTAVDDTGHVLDMGISVDDEFGYGPWYPIAQGVEGTFDIATLPFRLTFVIAAGMDFDEETGQWVPGPETEYSICSSHTLSPDPDALPIPAHVPSGASGTLRIDLSPFSEQLPPGPTDPPIHNVATSGEVDMICPGESGAPDTTVSGQFRVIDERITPGG